MATRHDKENFSIFDWFAVGLGVLVVGFILFILLWPFIDPTPERSSSIKQNIESLGGK